MSKDPPVRPGITFEIGARLEAQDYLQKWYPAKIEKIDYEEGKMLVHFERWSSRYDEWIHWDSGRIRPLERPALRKEGLRDDEENCDFKEGEEVLARWTDCRYYPAKIETINKEGTYTVQFYDGVIRCLKKMHIKSMPEDAKGQDWIALVKAAAAVVKNKSINKPRTSVNSNKDKEERKLHKVSSKKEDPIAFKPMELYHRGEEPTSSRNLEIAMEEVPKPPLARRDDDILMKRKISQASSFQAKRARLNKITGLLASKAVVLDDAEKKEQAPEKPLRLEEAVTPKLQTQKVTAAVICHAGISLQPTLMLPTLSSGKARRKKDKPEPGDASGCKNPPNSITDPQLKQGTPHNINISRSCGRSNNNRRRRSQRKTDPSDFPRLSYGEEKTLPGYALAPHDLSIAKVPDVTILTQEKVEPLDLSRSSELRHHIGPEPTFRPDSTFCKETELIQLLAYPSRAICDGRLASTSSAPGADVRSSHPNLGLSNNLRLAKGTKKKKSSVSIRVEGSDALFPVPGMEKLPLNLQDKIIKKVNERDKTLEAGVIKAEKKVKTEEKVPSLGKKKDKDKDRKDKKEKDHSKSKQKKKKKKKKKSKQHEYSDFEDSSLDYLEQSSSPAMRTSSSILTSNDTATTKNISFQFPRAILSVDLTGENLSDMEFLDDSSTESLILSGDEYNLEFDSTNFESQDEEEAINEIVRCVCEMDEENGFMIQCEECLCWQHSVCMGLLEDSIPEQYICYVCSNPPGQRWSARHKYDRDWFSNGRMCGLSFINENYSYINTKKIVSTHHLLADVYGVTEILHGLQLKFGILKDKTHPDLQLWACPVKPRELGQVNEKLLVNFSNDRSLGGQSHKVSSNKLNKMEDTYIVNEHSYQKPQGLGGKSSNDTGRSENDGGMLSPGQISHFPTDHRKGLQDSTNTERKNNLAMVEEASTGKKAGEEQMESHLQWQLNLLTHIESVQNEVNSRMDLIEKEVDVLESWLDFTGELEPPDPLTRLPQLKRRIKQLLTDMGKVQQIATLCSV